MKILVVAHGHPNYSKGGGEIAAYNQYEVLREMGHEVYFLGWNSSSEGAPAGRPIEQIGTTEWLISTKVDFFTFSSLDEEAIHGYKLLLEAIRPQAVHFHHFIHLGIELPHLTKTVLPGVRVLMTLHEYLLICNNNGQMVRPTGELCVNSSPASCNRCFPSISPEAFFMREGYIKNSLSAVDKFYSPSNFLRERMIAWGIPSDKIQYSPNVLRLRSLKRPRKGSLSRIQTFGFFGQINPYKGLDLLLDAFHIALKGVPNGRLIINGTVSKINQPEYTARLTDKLGILGKSVVLNGPYSSEQLPTRFGEVGWLVMSSKWWENSPVVIQEAFAAQTPIIVPDIGGMIEQLRGTGFGLSYKVNDPVSLANTLMEAATMSEEKYHNLLDKAPRLKTNKEIVAEMAAF